jgi:hypothetical protein
MSDLVPHFANWMIEMDKNPHFIHVPRPETAKLPKGFFERVGTYTEGKGKGKASEAKRGLYPPPPSSRHDNGIFTSGPLALSWELECENFKLCQDVFHTWNSTVEISLRQESRSLKQVVQRAMSVYPQISIPEGTGSNTNRISSKWRIAMLLLMIHDARCRFPLMKTKGISAFLYTSLADRISDFAIDSERFDFVIGHAKSGRSDGSKYLNNPTTFVRNLQGLPEESENESDEGDSPLSHYKQLRKQHQTDIHSMRHAFKNLPWIHYREKTMNAIDDDLVEAWNEFEGVSQSLLPNCHVSFMHFLGPPSIQHCLCDKFCAYCRKQIWQYAQWDHLRRGLGIGTMGPFIWLVIQASLLQRLSSMLECMIFR